MNAFESGSRCSKTVFDRLLESFHAGKIAVVSSMTYAYSADLIYA